jgi:hypothetical protein
VSSDESLKGLEMAAVMAGNHTHAAEIIDFFGFQIDCLWQWQLIYCFPIIVNCVHGIVAWQIGYQEESYLWSSVDICLLTWVGIKDGSKLLENIQSDID